MKATSILYIPFLFCFSCKKNTVSGGPPFESMPQAKIVNPLINEISGIADSKLNAGYVWGEEDSGNPPQIHLVRYDGSVAKTVYIKGITNRDWEDMSLFNNEIYIAETGDNSLAFSEYRFYKFSEPSLSTDTVKIVDTVKFVYPDGSHDAEAFLIDPSTKNIYIITKNDNPSRIYKLSYPYSNLTSVSFVGTLPFSTVTSAAMSADGKEIIIKTYPSVYYYQRSAGESLEQALQHSYTALGYQLEPQGEAVCFALDGSGFFTLSEKGFSSSVSLYFYKRK